jgi:hypothetical protein
MPSRGESVAPHARAVQRERAHPRGPRAPHHTSQVSRSSPTCASAVCSICRRGSGGKWDPDRRPGLAAASLAAGPIAAAHVHQNDRPALEHLCRYGGRLPVAIERLSQPEDGLYSYALKYPLADGSRELVLSGQQMMSRLVLLIQRPRGLSRPLPRCVRRPFTLAPRRGADSRPVEAWRGLRGPGLLAATGPPAGVLARSP